MRPQPPRPISSDHDATGQMISFLVAGVILVASVATVLLAARSGGRNDLGTREADQQAQAERLSDILVRSQGVGWGLGNDNVKRLGLMATNGSGLQQSSLDALRGALFVSTPNGKVDYPDARAGLGLTGTQDFHLRMGPQGLPAIYKAGDSRQRVAYIGDWQSLGNINVPLSTPSGEQVAAQAAINVTTGINTAAERLALRQLGLNYVDNVYIGPGNPTVTVAQVPPLPGIPLLTLLNVPYLDGGVYPDVKSYIDAVLPGRLANYDLLIVGSNVDQNSLTTGGTKTAISNWVLGGGSLIVLGSGKMNQQWLQPLFSTGVRTANGAASAPDPSHPLLQDPHVLNWGLYNDHGQGWDVSKTNGFSNVIVQGGQDVLAVSNDGAFGPDGRVILTTYQDGEIAATLGQLEADNFLENAILYTNHANLYLDYGPTQPTDAPVAVAVRDSYLYDDTLGQVPVRIEVHLWGTP